MRVFFNAFCFSVMEAKIAAKGDSGKSHHIPVTMATRVFSALNYQLGVLLELATVVTGKYLMFHPQLLRVTSCAKCVWMLLLTVCCWSVGTCSHVSSVAVSWQNVPSVDSTSPELCMPLKYEPPYSIFSILVSRGFIQRVIKNVMFVS